MLVLRPDLIFNAFKHVKDFNHEMQKTRIVGLDSMMHKNKINKKAHLVIITWLNAMIKGYKTIVYQLNKNTVPLLQPVVPQQVNGFECGIYCLQFAEIVYNRIEEYSFIFD